MSSKNTVGHILRLIGGSILTLAGIFLLIFEFSGSKGSDLGYAPYIVLFFGLGLFGVAFNKHKKAQNLVQNNPPPIQKGNNAASIETEHKPPPVNQS